MKQYDEKKRMLALDASTESTSVDSGVDLQAGNVTEQTTNNRLGFSDDSDMIRLKPDEKKKVR